MNGSVFTAIDRVENEKHFLLKCPLYDDNRNALLQICAIEIENLGNISTENKFIEIMKNKNSYCCSW